MGKGKSIYSGDVLGNRKGKIVGKKGLQEQFLKCTMQTKQNTEHEMEREP